MRKYPPLFPLLDLAESHDDVIPDAPAHEPRQNVHVLRIFGYSEKYKACAVAIEKKHQHLLYPVTKKKHVPLSIPANAQHSGSAVRQFPTDSVRSALPLLEKLHGLNPAIPRMATQTVLQSND